MKKFNKNNSVYFECTYRDFDGSIKDPTNPKYQIYNSKGEKEWPEDQSPDGANGIYHFIHALTVADTYLVQFTGTIAGNSGIARSIFKVVETKIK